MGEDDVGPGLRPRPHLRRSMLVGTVILAGLLGFGLFVQRERQRDARDQALFYAVAAGDVDGVTRHLREGADPNARTFLGSAPPNTLSGLRRLFGKDQRQGKAPLTLAAQLGWTDIARVLLDRGAAVDGPDSGGSTPLMYAVQEGRTEIVVLLLDRGANVEARDRDGVTPLMLAADMGRREVDLLLRHGASVSPKDRFGRTALDHAKAAHWLHAAEVLRKAAARRW